MNKKYEKPELDVELFDVDDVITASGATTEEATGDPVTTPDQADI